VIAQDAKTVTFEANFEGLIVRQQVARSQIKSLTTEVRTGPGYCVIPMKGEVGVGITAEAVKGALNMAREDGAKYVILDFDSPGGSVQEMGEIIAVMRDAKDLTLVAYVEKNAISAAAMIAMGCPKIYMAEGGAIGAAVPWQVGPNGTPVNVEQKFESAYRGIVRANAESAGHSALFVRGMTEMDVELALKADEYGKLQLVEETPGQEEEGVKVIKERGKIMTLTGTEAVASGLGAGIVRGIEDIRAGLGVAAWHKVAEGAEAYVQNHAKAETAQRQDMTTGEIQRRLDELTAKKEDLKKQMKEKEEAYHGEIAAVRDAYNKAIDVPQTPSEAAAYQAQVKSHAQSQVDEINSRYRPIMIDLATQLRAASADEGVLRGLMGKYAGN
jgi:membrane-bound serine protease (ClpP class)